METAVDIRPDVSAPAQVGEFDALQIGPLRIWPPVVLAPMAGVTNVAYRSLCRRFGAGLYVSEMVTARLLTEQDAYTLQVARFGPQEWPRSIQLYGTDPDYMGKAVSWLVSRERVDHIDINFGCPMRKITRKGGGAAIPLKPRLLARLLRAAVQNAGDIPVTMKMRIGISDQYQSYLTAGRIAESEGCRAVALHARTAAQLYSGQADWSAIARLKSAIHSIPVLGNGDIWEAGDALKMMRTTGCDGVVIGRGCLGRPWIFRHLAEMFDGRLHSSYPVLGEVADMMRQHAAMLCELMPESIAIKSFRKHCLWYLKGFDAAEELRPQLLQINTLADLQQILAEVDHWQPFRESALREPHGKRSTPQKVSLPAGYLEELDDDTPPDAAAEDPSSGG